MNFNEIYTHGKTPISFEIFPPKTEKGLENLFKELDKLAKFNPEFISVTYGAGGSTREKTLDIALNISKQYDIEPLIHFTCVGASKDEIKLYLEKIKKLGLKNILALRGDPPQGMEKFQSHEKGFSYASQLVDYINSLGDFNVAVAGYPECHVEAANLDEDISNLKKKVDAGAELIITQLFFDNDDYYNFMEKIAKAGITTPVVPGIMPITNRDQMKKITELCGAKIPPTLEKGMESLSTPEEMFDYGVNYAINQCKDLLSRGVKGFHFYPLNKAEACTRILESLNL